MGGGGGSSDDVEVQAGVIYVLLLLQLIINIPLPSFLSFPVCAPPLKANRANDILYVFCESTDFVTQFGSGKSFQLPLLHFDMNSNKN